MSSQPNRGPPKSMVWSKNKKKLAPRRIQRFRTLKISLRPDPRGDCKADVFKKNAETKYAVCRGKTPFGDRSEIIQGRHQLEDVHSVEVKRGAALTPAAADGFTHVRSSYKTRGRAQSCQPSRGPPKKQGFEQKHTNSQHR